MNSYEIHIQSRKQAEELYDLLQLCTSDADLLQEQQRVDGRSLLGIYSLDFTKPVTLEAYGAKAQLEERLQSFMEE